MTLNTEFATYNNVEIIRQRYSADNSLYIGLVNEEGPIAILTKCLCDGGLANNESYVDINNCPWAPEFIEDNNLGYFTGKYGYSGFCSYPIYRFFEV